MCYARPLKAGRGQSSLDWARLYTQSFWCHLFHWSVCICRSARGAESLRACMCQPRLWLLGWAAHAWTPRVERSTIWRPLQLWISVTSRRCWSKWKSRRYCRCISAASIALVSWDLNNSQCTVTNIRYIQTQSVILYRVVQLRIRIAIWLPWQIDSIATNQLENRIDWIDWKIKSIESITFQKHEQYGLYG